MIPWFCERYFYLVSRICHFKGRGACPQPDEDSITVSFKHETLIPIPKSATWQRGNVYWQTASWYDWLATIYNDSIREESSNSFSAYLYRVCNRVKSTRFVERVNRHCIPR